jgi:hypothetical protein
MVNDNQMLGSNSITIFHQNICVLKGKMNEWISSMSPYSPHILCFSGHNPKKFELDQINVDGYRLGAAHCRQVLKKRWCLYVCSKKPEVYKY